MKNSLQIVPDKTTLKSSKNYSKAFRHSLLSQLSSAQLRVKRLNGNLNKRTRDRIIYGRMFNETTPKTNIANPLVDCKTFLDDHLLFKSPLLHELASHFALPCTLPTSANSHYQKNDREIRVANRLLVNFYGMRVIPEYKTHVSTAKCRSAWRTPFAIAILAVKLRSISDSVAGVI